MTSSSSPARGRCTCCPRFATAPGSCPNLKQRTSMRPEKDARRGQALSPPTATAPTAAAPGTVHRRRQERRGMGLPSAAWYRSWPPARRGGAEKVGAARTIFPSKSNSAGKRDSHLALKVRTPASRRGSRRACRTSDPARAPRARPFGWCRARKKAASSVARRSSAASFSSSPAAPPNPRRPLPPPPSSSFSSPSSCSSAASSSSSSSSSSLC
mmetsp:Transcript_91175/g.246471  ORF Transcript_91175/g.246471 Transcript_91175/m.246471 type:complete len:213 (+) Transcript_91175:608-1246(+)